MHGENSDILHTVITCKGVAEGAGQLQGDSRAPTPTLENSHVQPGLEAPVGNKAGASAHLPCAPSLRTELGMVAWDLWKELSSEP